MKDLVVKIERIEKQLEDMMNSFNYLMETMQLDLWEEMDYRLSIHELQEELEKYQSYL